MTMRLVRTCSGKSHSWLTPTISWSKPSANRISVADGSSETMRMRGTLPQESKWRERQRVGANFSKCAIKGEALFVQEVFAAEMIEGIELGVPAGDYFFRCDAFL